MNLPPVPDGYIQRPVLEKELYEVLLHPRHTIVTIAGRGGIGKTWLSLFTLDKLCSQTRYQCIIWFSARDIDLQASGAKLVKAHILNEKDISKEFDMLLNPSNTKSEADTLKYFQDALAKSPVGPCLFVFDNFETVIDPQGLFQWLDTFVRPDNKILITTRVRDFKGDYPIEVTGMSRSEFDDLIKSTSVSYNIQSLLSKEHKEEIFIESAGHPYVAKILLGEFAKNPHVKNVKRIVATRMDILDALFERTYNSLSPVARNIFLILCNWRSIIPQLALEAILLRPEQTERLDVEKAVDELRKSSFIEVLSDGSYEFLSVPLVAYQFGQGKLEVSPDKLSIQADTNLLMYFGPIQNSDIAHGIEPRIQRLFKIVAEKISEDVSLLEKYLPILEFTARRYAPAWLMLASLYEELPGNNHEKMSKLCIRRYIETRPIESDLLNAWKRLAERCEKANDFSGEAQAIVEMCKLSNTPFNIVSSTANRLNAMFHTNKSIFESPEKQILVKALVSVIESRISEALPNDLSRLSWLCLHLNDEDKARKYAEKGLEMDKNNYYCNRIIENISSRAKHK